MAKRKRLNLDMGGESPFPPAAAVPEVKSMPEGLPLAAGRGLPEPAPNLAPSAARVAPIAQIVGDASAQAALAALAQELDAARQSGRLVLQIPLDQIAVDHLHRDRMAVDPTDMADLVSSIDARGQQTPIEVTALPTGSATRFGLISGWRRLAALRHLHSTTGDARFATVLALLRQPENAAAAYRAMVEENEIRAGISYYERARIAALAAEADIFPDARAAIAGLFAAASRAKKSKIASFLKLYETLDSRLSFGPAISERLGLALVRAIDADADFGPRLRDRLRKAALDTAEAELALLEKALQTGGKSDPDKRRADPAPLAPQAAPVVGQTPAPASPLAHREEICPGIWLETEGGFSQAVLRLSGAKVDALLRDRLVVWLKAQARNPGS